MKKIKEFKGWGIYQNTAREVEECGFAVTVLHPDNMVYSYLCSPADSDIECNSVEDAENWINNY